ncbi:MAG: hypothetical protein R3B06_28720 [Kofleriaceae bacterium]
MLRALASVTAAVAAVTLGGALGGSLGLVVAGAWVALAALLVRFAFARFGHLMFVAGRMREARRYYGVLAVVAWRRSRRVAARVSIAATFLGQGDYRRGRAALDRLDPAELDVTTRAGWLNNRAYAALRDGASGTAAEAALADVRAALALHADVPALLHTEALALAACGRTEQAIAAYEALWQRGDLAPRLEAERCDDLADAWAARGERDYAADYRHRAAAAAAVRPWRGPAA